MTAHNTRQMTAIDMCKRLLSLSQAQRRLAHENKREAMEWERAGELARYRQCRKDSDRLWREAKWHLSWAKEWRGRI